MKHSAKIDVAVLITFFARPDTLQKVFESVKEARPTTLLLWQDGPRKNRPEDIENIQKCRSIVENIDWECTVYRNYHTENMGCDPSTFRAQKWAFDIVDKCIILEDDMVPSQSYYLFCKELLDKYENDDRINHICGVNPLGKADFCPNDYLFSFYGTGAWASWKRVAIGWDSTYSFLDDEYAMKNLCKKIPSLFNYKKAIKRRETGFEWWETLIGYNCYLNNRLVIVPRVNLVNNIGVTEGATHGSSLRMMNKKVRELFFMPSNEIRFPLKHPKYIVPDYDFMNEHSKINCVGRPWLSRYRKLEYYIKLIAYGKLINAIKRHINHKR